MAKCEPAAAAFFANLFETAEEHRCDISWGTKGFSLRSPGRPVFFYCYPPGARGRSTSDIEIFLRDLNDATLAEDMRHAFLEVPRVETMGQFTIRLVVSRATAVETERLVGLSLQFMERQKTR